MDLFPPDIIFIFLGISLAVSALHVINMPYFLSLKLMYYTGSKRPIMNLLYFFNSLKGES